MVDRRKSGYSQGQHGFRPRSPRIYKPDRSWKTHKEKPKHDKFVEGKVAKIKIIEIEPGLWGVLWVYFVVDEDDNYLDKGELIGKNLRVEEK